MFKKHITISSLSIGEDGKWTASLQERITFIPLSLYKNTIIASGKCVGKQLVQPHKIGYSSSHPVKREKVVEAVEQQWVVFAN